MARIKGTGGSDVLFGTDYNDIIRGRGGDDVIHTGAGNDRVYGGGGNDTIVIDSGTNQLYGGSGADVFQVTDLSSGRSNLRDWQDGLDKIDLTDLGISSIDQLNITQSGSWTMIDTGTVDVAIKTADLTSALSADDFVFADAPAPDPDPDPLPANATLIDFNNMTLWTPANGESKTGDFVVQLDGWFGWNSDMVDGVSGNGFIYPQYTDYFGGSGVATVKADTNVMANDTFDLEAFKTADPNGFTLVAFNDGVEVGREDFAGVGPDWTEVRPDDAIFDAVDEVQFVGINGIDDLLIIA